MENQEIIKQENKLANMPAVENLAIQLFHVNQLTPYPYSDAMLEAWAVSILELTPEIKAEDLKFIIDKMKLGAIPYDSKKGIQNIFNGYLLLLTEKIEEISRHINNDNLYGHFKSEDEAKLFKEKQKKIDNMFSIKKRLKSMNINNSETYISSYNDGIL